MASIVVANMHHPFVPGLDCACVCVCVCAYVPIRKGKELEKLAGCADRLLLLLLYSLDCPKERQQGQQHRSHSHHHFGCGRDGRLFDFSQQLLSLLLFLRLVSKVVSHVVATGHALSNPTSNNNENNNHKISHENKEREPTASSKTRHTPRNYAAQASL